jgi:hypothetical protein
MDIRVVRALWGKLEWFKDEIPNKPLFNELVVVWGEENFNYLKSLGYDCIFVSSDAKVKDPDSIEAVVEVYQHKLEALEIAMKTHSKVLFLDWDTLLVKELDDKFWSTFEGVSFQAPLYRYPLNMNEEAPYLNNHKPSINWANIHTEYSPNYSWLWENSCVMPMAGYIYLSDPEQSKELLRHYKEKKIRGFIDEFSIFCLADCSLDEYIERHVPPTLLGRESELVFKFGRINDTIYKPLNDYIGKTIDYDIYFIHD